MLSATANLLKNIGDGQTAGNSGQIIDVNGTVFFIANRRIWKSDGTISGTVPVNEGIGDVATNFTAVGDTLYYSQYLPTTGSLTYGLWKNDGKGNASIPVGGSVPYPFANFIDVSGMLFFTGYSRDNGTELWKSDGTPEGTAMVKDIRPGPLSSFAYYGNSLAAIGTSLFFFAADETHGRELWKSDGTSDGTVMVKDIVVGAGSGVGTQTTVSVGGLVYFNGNGGLWRSDGTEAGTVRVLDAEGQSVGASSLTNVAGTLFFVASYEGQGGQLWKIDGNGVATHVFSTAQQPFTVTSYGAQQAAVGDQFYFMASDGPHGNELWKSDGTEAGTSLVSDVNPGAAGSNITSLTNVSGLLFFVDTDAAHGAELWKSDGTAAGTRLVKDITPGPLDSVRASQNPGGNGLVNVAGTLYFSASDRIHGYELWKSDGTEAGTVLVRDADNRSTASSAPLDFVDFKGLTYFAATDAQHGRELWRTDGTPSGTILFADLNPGWHESNPQWFISTSGALYFVTSDDPNGVFLWKTDGTPLGTKRLKTLPIDFSNTSDAPVINFNDTLFFRTRNADGGGELWKSDGTELGTLLVKHFDSAIGKMSIFNGSLILQTSGSLWRTDGTADGTQPLATVSVGDSAAVGNWLYFAATDDEHGTELWKTDGTPEGTSLVKDILPGPPGPYPGIPFYYPDRSSSYPSRLIDFNGTLLFFAFVDGSEDLWRSDGTEAGTTRITTGLAPSTSPPFPPALYVTFVPGKQWLLFAVFNANVDKYQFWQTDGSAAGTMLLPDAIGIDGMPLGVLHGNEFLLSVATADGPELWETDGTRGGTSLVKRGVAATVPVVASDGLVYLRGPFDKYSIAPLWVTDGTGAGTNRVTDANSGIPITLYSYDLQFTFINGNLFLPAITTGTYPIINTQPWIIPADPPVARLFYNHSQFDGGDAAAGADDDKAIATDKFAYLPGTGPTQFENVSSYSQGINGLMVDLPAGVANVSADDFTFRVGRDNSPDNWATLGTTPSLTLRSGSGVGGADRVELTWPDGTIQNTWLEVTVKANADSGLATPYTFYFGSLIGDSGFGNDDPDSAATDVVDFLMARAAAESNVPIANPYDFNRDGQVDVADWLLSRAHAGNELPLILLSEVISPTPAALPLQASPSPDGSAVAVALTMPVPSAIGTTTANAGADQVSRGPASKTSAAANAPLDPTVLSAAFARPSDSRTPGDDAEIDQTDWSLGWLSLTVV